MPEFTKAINQWLLNNCNKNIYKNQYLIAKEASVPYTICMK
jgi:hypothetical protein